MVSMDETIRAAFCLSVICFFDHHLFIFSIMLIQKNIEIQRDLFFFIIAILSYCYLVQYSTLALLLIFKLLAQMPRFFTVFTLPFSAEESVMLNFLF